MLTRNYYKVKGLLAEALCSSSYYSPGIYRKLIFPPYITIVTFINNKDFSCSHKTVWISIRHVIDL